MSNQHKTEYRRHDILTYHSTTDASDRMWVACSTAAIAGLPSTDHETADFGKQPSSATFISVAHILFYLSITSIYRETDCYSPLAGSACRCDSVSPADTSEFFNLYRLQSLSIRTMQFLRQ